MSASSENPAPPLAVEPRSSRPVEELAVTLAFGPVANGLVRLLARTRLAPATLVVAHGAIGLAAAGLLAREELVAAALLLQARTVLDNADGRLARASGRVTLLGRYLDTVVDLAVNVSLFAALAAVTGERWLALAAFLALTLVLTVDFNVSELYREAHGEPSRPPPATGSRAERALAAAYSALFAPQDRLVRRFSERRLRAVLGAEKDARRVVRATLAYHDRATASILANLGLSTQLAVLGLCLLAGEPVVYLWLVLVSLLLLPTLQARRERLARDALAR
ncbi:MAG: CDP-alcohol phosphatidyltransferase family protein [Thermoleophilia bacterium]|nr:CDP-alcohol phosphatidyltransferase family protein [Gaiellaceae bacterium]MDW8339056.1 CDP-alcohol phosphatidyltransferase family protein [Thermoleophilia bacterium]